MSLQECCDFGCYFLHSALNRYWHSLNQLLQLIFLFLSDCQILELDRHSKNPQKLYEIRAAFKIAVVYRHAGVLDIVEGSNLSQKISTNYSILTIIIHQTISLQETEGTMS